MTRTQIIQTLIDKFKLTRYLEIGVFNGENFNKINCEVKHSVDPNYPATFEMTSDEFFKDNQYHKKIGDPELRYDIIFIDGLHTAEQTYKDIINSLQILNENGFIVVHDCSPETEWHTRPESEYKRGEEWNGKTYKGFIRYKEDSKLSCFTIDADYGCGIITERDVLKNVTHKDYKDYSEKEGFFNHFNRHRKSYLQLITSKAFLELI